MIIERDRDIISQSTIAGVQYDMTIDNDSVEKLMALLTNAYQDPEMAIIREYANNALDAQIEIGVTTPIEVTLPSPLAPFLKIKDRGVGLSMEDIGDIYSKYGRSTKRETNEQTGALGIGAKSALAYTNQFTIVAIKDGERIQVSVSINEDGKGVMTVADRCLTDEHSGVEIIIPAKAKNQIESKAREFFSYWRPGTVTINGEPAGCAKGEAVGDDMMLVPNPSAVRYSRTQSSRIIMGSVPYPVTFEGLDLPYDVRLLVTVPLGAVDFTPAREELRYTTRTKEAVDSIESRFRQLLPQTIQEQLDDCDTHPEALAALLRWEKLLPSWANNLGSYRYRGQSIPQQIRHNDRIVHAAVESRSMSTHMSTSTYSTLYVPRTAWVTNYDGSSFSPWRKRKLLAWREQQANVEDIEHFALVRDLPDSPWINEAMVFDWEQVKLVPVQTSTSANGPRRRSQRLPGSYQAFIRGQWVESLAANDINTDESLFHHATGKLDANLRDVLVKFHPWATIVIVPRNRLAKYQRMFPGSQDTLAALRQTHAQWLQTVDRDQLAAVVVRRDYHLRSVLRALDPQRVADPELSHLARMAHQDAQAVFDEQMMFHKLKHIAALDSDNEFMAVINRYPLLRSTGALINSDPDHVYLYLTAVYRNHAEEDATTP